MVYWPSTIAVDQITIAAKIMQEDRAYTFYIKRLSSGYRVWGPWGQEEKSRTLWLALYQAHLKAHFRLGTILMETVREARDEPK